MELPKNLSGLLVTSKSNIRYLSNFTGSSGFMLLSKKKKFLFTDFRYLERAERSIPKDVELINTTKMWKNKAMLAENWQKILKQAKITELGLEEDNLTLAQFKRFKSISSGLKIKFKDNTGFVEKIRSIKRADELKSITKSQEINEATLAEIKKIIRAKKVVTEAELAWKIKEIGRNLGAEDVSFDPIVAFGKNSAIPHHEPGKSLLKKSDVILIDMGMKYQGYCSDMTRTLVSKSATAKEKEVYHLVLEAQLNALKHIKAGVTGKEADSYSRDIIKAAGYGENYGHAGGHGIGLDIHEMPSLSENSKEVFEENMVVTVEPGIYLPGKFGVRIEDMILLTKSGNKNLTKVDKNLF